MHFAIGTKNIPKSSAIEHVLATSPYTSGATFSNHTVVSGVPDMPTTLEELRTGAKNRAIHTRREYPQADYFVGMEGGVYQDYEGETYWLLGIVYIENQDGEGHYGYSCHLEVPKAVVDGLFDGRGRDLEQVVHALGGEANIGDKQGSFHAWTDGMLTRRDQFIMATQCAIAPFFNEFYQKTPSPTQEMLLQKATEINKKFGSQFIPPRGNQTMKYYFLEPEVAGGLGEKSIIDSTIHPPKVDKLQYIFSGWLGDAILESFPCVIVTQGASDALQDNQVTGMEFADVEVLTSSEFRELYPEGNLPSFKWLKVNGKPGKDDFGIADDGRLVVSTKVLKLLHPFGITHALITDFISSKKKQASMNVKLKRSKGYKEADMDEFMEDFLGFAGFGPAFACHSVPPETIEKFRGRLPDKLLEYWQIYGWCGYAKGLFWTVDPEAWEETMLDWIGETPFVERDTYHVIARTAFGDLILWGEKTGQSLKVVTSWGMIYPNFDLQEFVSRGANLSLQLFFASSSRDEFDLMDDKSRPLFERALAKLGPLDHDTVYGFVPALALSGSPSLQSLQKLDAQVHLSILSQITERQIMRDINADARAAGLI